MTEKGKFERMAVAKPVPMKLFAAWEVDRTPSNCIPRLCSLTITRLSLLTPLPPDLTSLSLAVKMQSSKRTLRSHEITVPQPVGNSITGGLLQGPPLLDTELDLHFSLQYPHFIKRDGNRLLILLQRRKKYKTRTILGYKTLAEGVIRMDAVLQKSMDMTVELLCSGKAGRPGMPIATLRATQVSSMPVDQDNKNNNSVLTVDRVNEYSDEDEEQEFSSGDENDEGLSGYAAKRSYAGKRGPFKKFDRIENDGEADENNLIPANQVDSDSDYERDGKGNRAKLISRRNFKQKIISLLKRFKVPDELESDVPRNQALEGEQDLDALFQELESLSCGEGDDSGNDMDSVSISSTPKPSLRPFFTTSKTTLQDSIKDLIPDKKISLEKRDSIAEKKSSNAITITNNIINNMYHVNNNNQERGNDWKNDSSGNEGGAGGNTDPEAMSADLQNTGSPPKDKDSSGPVSGGSDRKSRLFRTSSSTPSSAAKKKQSLSFFSEPPKSALETCLSPTNVEPRKSLLDQVSRTFATEETQLPDIITLIGPAEYQGSPLTPRLQSLLMASFRPVTFVVNNTAEVRAVIQALMNKIQKYCNSTAKPPYTIKVLLVGGDWMQGAVLRHYVELLSVRPPDWVNHIRFYIVPIGSTGISRYISAIDQTYLSMFGTENWQQLCDRAGNLESSQSKVEMIEITNRIQRYLHSGGPCTQVPIAEAMVNYKDEDSCQIFVPFISDVRIGYQDGPQVSLDLEESQSQISQFNMSVSIGGQVGSSSPPPSGRSSPPFPMPLTPSSITSTSADVVELQIDYWPLVRPMESKDNKGLVKGQEHGKNSIKSTFRNLQVARLPLNPILGELPNGLTLSYSTKEKKQKIMRLGKKKEKDKESEKEQCVEGIARLICSPKQSHPIPLRVYIDGTEWTGVKFFQLSSQWQTHIKNFPIALIGGESLSFHLSH